MKRKQSKICKLKENGISPKLKEEEKKFKGGKFKAGDSITILWKDTLGDDSSWCSKEDFDFVQAVAGSIIRVDGTLVNETKAYLFIAQFYRPVDGLFARVATVPKDGIVKIWKRK